MNPLALRTVGLALGALLSSSAHADVLSEVEGSDDLYVVLGISPDDSASTLKSTFRQRAIQIHPDRCEADLRPRCENAMKKLNSAYEIAETPDRLAEYRAGWIDVWGTRMTSPSATSPQPARARTKAPQNPRAWHGAWAAFDENPEGELARIVRERKNWGPRYRVQNVATYLGNNLGTLDEYERIVRAIADEELPYLELLRQTVLDADNASRKPMPWAHTLNAIRLLEREGSEEAYRILQAFHRRAAYQDTSFGKVGRQTVAEILEKMGRRHPPKDFWSTCLDALRSTLR